MSQEIADEMAEYWSQSHAHRSIVNLFSLFDAGHYVCYNSSSEYCYPT
jgi:hypothetical protein